ARRLASDRGEARAFDPVSAERAPRLSRGAAPRARATPGVGGLRDRRRLQLWVRRARAATGGRELPLVRPGDALRALRGLGADAARAHGGRTARRPAGVGL